METVDWCPVGGEHSWYPKILDLHHECSGDDDCVVYKVTADWCEECLKCLARRQPSSANASRET